MTEQINYSKIKTVVYSPSGYFGSYKLWRDPSYAFQHRNEIKFVPYGTYAAQHDFGDWVYLGNNTNRLAELLKVEMYDLPQFDYEFFVIGR